MKQLLAVFLILISTFEAFGAPKLSNCEYLLPPVGGTEDELTKKPLAVAVAECEDEKGAERMVMAYCLREHWEDPNDCVNNESNPELQPLVKASSAGEKPPKKDNKDIAN